MTLLESIQEMKTALDAEEAEEKRQFQEELLLQPLAERVKQGISLMGLEWTDTESIAGDAVKITLQKNVDLGDHRFGPGNPVLIQSETTELFGVVTKVSEKDIQVLVDDFPEIEETGISLTLSINRSSYKAMGIALESLKDAKKDRLSELRDILYGIKSPVLEPIRDLDNMDKLSKSYVVPSSIPIDKQLSHLNPSQKKAVLGIVQAQDFAIIHGPPGTGKTTVLIEAVQILYHQGKKILLTAPTNSATDLLAEKCLEVGIPFVRMGQLARMSDRLLSHSLDSLLEKHPNAKSLSKWKNQTAALWKKVKTFHRNFGKKEREARDHHRKELKDLRNLIKNTESGIIETLLDGRNVIITTLGSSFHEKIRNREFDVSISDEAAQALEPQAWLPLLSAQKIILAGDHCQLPPLVLCPGSVLEKTLFEKAINHYKKSPPVFFLEEQYRMEDIIMSFSNSWFYENKLRTHESVNSRPKWKSSLFSKSPLVFVNTAGTDTTEEAEVGKDSIYNRVEAQMAWKLAVALVEETEGKEEISLLSPYRGQIRLWNEMVKQKQGIKSKLKVETIDSFQGRETDVMLLSLVRSNETGDTGFLEEYRRMNVALTRPRKLLVVLGDSSTLSQNVFFASFMKFVEERGDYRSAWEFLED